MEIIKTSIDGVVIIKPRIFSDFRGYFFESFNQKKMRKESAKLSLYKIMKVGLTMVLSVVFIFRSLLLLKVN